MDSNGRSGSSPVSLVIPVEGKRSLESLELRSKGADIEGPIFHDSDTDSLTSNSPICSQNNIMKDLRSGGSFSSSGSGSGSSSWCSENVSEAEEDDCVDDWEAVADALTANEKQSNPNIEPPIEPKTDGCQLACPKSPKKNFRVGSGPQENCRAWRHDDAFRPQSLPHILKKHTVDMKSSCGAITWAWQNIMSRPSLCPICYEDLDLTDSSFLPCPCGFHLCLFCHKRILEEDGRCPGCRKQYDLVKLNLPFNHRPFKMSTRS